MTKQQDTVRRFAAAAEAAREEEKRRLYNRIMGYNWKRFLPNVNWRWLKWTFGFWIDPKNHTYFGIDIGPLEIVWHSEGYRP